MFRPNDRRVLPFAADRSPSDVQSRRDAAGVYEQGFQLRPSREHGRLGRQSCVLHAASLVGLFMYKTGCLLGRQTNGDGPQVGSEHPMSFVIPGHFIGTVRQVFDSPT